MCFVQDLSSIKTLILLTYIQSLFTTYIKILKLLTFSRSSLVLSCARGVSLSLVSEDVDETSNTKSFPGST